MRLRRQVSDQEYQKAYNCLDNIKIIKRVTRKYKAILNPDELESCGMQGLWEALANHVDGMGQKFTTSLYTYVNWRCMNQVRNNKKFSKEFNFTDLEFRCMKE